jgi:hypothetical protein
MSMVRRFALSALLGGFACGAAAPALAQYYAPPPPPPPVPRAPGIDRDQAQHEAWLRQGIANGRITPGEAQRIREAMADLRRHEAQAKRDGVITPAERQRLREHADRVDAMISRNYHDAQAMPPRFRSYW